MPRVNYMNSPFRIVDEMKMNSNVVNAMIWNYMSRSVEILAEILI